MEGEHAVLLYNRVRGNDRFPLTSGVRGSRKFVCVRFSERPRPTRVIKEGDTVAGRFKCSGTHRGKFLGEAPTGKRMEVEEVFLLRAEDGKFVNFWALEDSMGRMRQLGLIPTPKP